MKSNDSANMLIDPMDAERLSTVLMNSGAINMMIDTTKKMMWSMVEYKDLQMVYTCAMKEVETKLDILSTEFNLKHKRNPISFVSSRLKRSESIAKKLSKNDLTFTIENIEKYIHDVAGIRVVCSYIDDIYAIADALLLQDDIKLIERKDYIKNPKPNGYRSLHLIICVPVFLADGKKEVKVEVQIRTIAMDFWASLEHQMKYKKNISDQASVCEELRACAEVIAATDNHMLTLRQRIELAEDIPADDDVLFERLSKLDVPIR